MKREFLEKLGLEKEVIDQIMEENGNDINAEKAKITAKDEEIKTLQEQVNTANKEIKSFKDMDIEAIKQASADWETKAKGYKQDLQNLRNETSLKDAIKTYNSVDEDVLLKLLDRDVIKFNDDGITGLKEQVENLKVSKPYLFKETKQEENNNGNDNRFNAHEPPTPEGGGASAMESTIASIFSN